jgi:hypothetical protein
MDIANIPSLLIGGEIHQYGTGGSAYFIFVPTNEIFELFPFFGKVIKIIVARFSKASYMPN